MDSLQSLDLALFRFVNLDLKNRLFDAVLPYFDSNRGFIPLLVVLAIWLTWKGGLRGRLLVFFLLLTFVIGDPVIVKSLKNWFARPRPGVSVAGIHLLVGKTDKGSMPSGHTANWFAAAVVAIIYYRWSLWFMLPLAVTVGFSRIYLGAHYPSDVLVGAVLGVGYATLIVWASDAIWRLAGPRWFPLWWQAAPSFLNPAPWAPGAGPSTGAPGSLDTRRRPNLVAATPDQHWVRLAYLLIGLLLLGHLIYIGSAKIELSEDEAYQWLWSKHLALSYYSKPPLIAYTQFLGTWLWGDTAFGIRFFSPVLGALAGVLLVRFLAREANGLVACLSVLVASAAPMLMAGATLMTIDALSVLFWVAAMVSGWHAVQANSTGAWLWTGLWMGLGFLSKYVGLFQWLSWAVFFAVWPAARGQLRRPGPYLALLINVLCIVPVVVWNTEHHWITMTHLANRGGLDKAWNPTFRFMLDFLLQETGLLNPIFFLGTIWAALAFWKIPVGTAFWRYLFSMGAPLFLFYLVYTLRTRVQPNWIAPAVLPLFCLMLVYWEGQWRIGRRAVRHWLMAGIALGWLVVVPLHDTNLIAQVTGKPLSWELDPLTRVLAWTETAQVVDQARAELQREGKPVFIIGGHYGITSTLSFYLPGARRSMPENTRVYYVSSDVPQNQFFFWPGYQSRKGQNAIYVNSVDRPDATVPPILRQEFGSITDLGIHIVMHRDRVFHRVRLFACRDLR